MFNLTYNFKRPLDLDTLRKQISITVEELNNYFNSQTGDVNVGNIYAYNLYLSGGNIDLTPAAFSILLRDNEATALAIMEGSNNYLVFDTTDSAEKISLYKKTLIGADANTTDFSASQVIISNGNTGATNANATALTLESTGSSGTIIGNWGYAQNTGTGNPYGGFFQGQTTTNGVQATGVYGLASSTNTGAGGVNIGGLFSALGASSNYAIKIASGNIYFTSTGGSKYFYFDRPTVAGNAVIFNEVGGNADPYLVFRTVNGATPYTNFIDIYQQIGTTNINGLWQLKDNDASSFTFDTTDKTGMLVFDTRNGAERITMSCDLVVSGSVTNSGLTATRIPFASTGGLLVDSANMTFVTDTLTVTKLGATSLAGTLTGGANTISGTAFDINGGTVDSITSLTVANNVDIGNFNLRALSLTADGLTAGRVVFAGADGLLSDDADLTFATDTLTATKIVGSTHLQTDTIIEKTADTGVTIDGVLLKDSQVTTDVINEKTAAAGVTIDGLNIMNDGTTTTLLGTAGDYVRIGDAGTTGHSLASNDDLMVTGILEVDGIAYADAGINFGDETLANYDEGTFTPTVTLVGGAGNTTPVYSTNIGRYTRTGNRVDCDIALYGDGGAEGAGTGQINVALPFTASANNGYRYYYGLANNGTARYILMGAIDPSGTTIYFYYFSSVSATANFTGADQNNTSRAIRIYFNYEV